MFRSVFSSDPSSLWKRYAVALSLIFGIVAIGHYLEFKALKYAEDDAALVNMSGKQRMLSQTIVVLALTPESTADVDSVQRLEAAITEFETAHQHLVGLSSQHPGLEDIYLTGDVPLDPLVRDHIQFARNVMEDTGAFSNNISTLYEMGTGILPARLDDAVSEFEAIANRNSVRIHRIQQSTLMVAVLIILLEAIFIFLPAQRIVRASMRQLKTEVDEHEAANDRLSNFVNLAADLYWESDMNSRVTYVEGRFLDQMKGTREDLLGCLYSDLVSFSPEEAIRMANALGSLEPYRQIQAKFVDADGKTYVLQLNGMPRYDRDGRLIGYIGTADDISAKVNLIDEATRLALTDPLTGVANKRAFETQLEGMMAACSVSTPVTLLALDLDRFKPINDTHGHGAGDEVLKVVAERLKSCLRKTDSLARTGGDEFCIICENNTTEHAGYALARRISQTIIEPIELSSGAMVRIGISIGIAEAPLNASTPDGLLKEADAALYEAKDSGRNTIRAASGWITAFGANDETPPIRIAV